MPIRLSQLCAAAAVVKVIVTLASLSLLWSSATSTQQLLTDLERSSALTNTRAVLCTALQQEQGAPATHS